MSDINPSDSLVPMEKETSRQLTDKQKMFIEYYCGISRMNGTDAARRAGYSDPIQSAWMNKTNVDICNEIEKRLQAKHLTETENLSMLADFAKGSLKPFLYTKGDMAVIDLEGEEAQHNIHLLKKIKTKRKIFHNAKNPELTTEIIETEIELEDRVKSIELVGKALGTWKAETTNNTQVNILYNLPDQELETMIHEAKLQDSVYVSTVETEDCIDTSYSSQNERTED